MACGVIGSMEDYTCFFEKLADGLLGLLPGSKAEATSVEIDEIAALGRLILEINEPTQDVVVTTACQVCHSEVEPLGVSWWDSSKSLMEAHMSCPIAAQS